MKILPGRELRHFSAYVLGLTILFIAAQLALLIFRFSRVGDTQAKIDLVRTAQLKNEKISVQVQQFLAGSSADAANIAAGLNDLDNQLDIISKGGNIDQHLYVKPLGRLAAITFSGLKEDWSSYKRLVYILMSRSSGSAVIADSLLDRGDALSILVHSNQDAARVQYEGLSLLMSNWYDKLVTDLHEELAGVKSSVNNILIALAVSNLLYFGGMFVLFRQKILKPVSDLTSRIKAEQKGEVTPDEFGKLTAVVNEKIELISDASGFIAEIGKGNLDIEYNQAFDHHYARGSNALTDSLIDMQMKLKLLNEEEQKRQWANDGVGKFIEIIRTSGNNLTVLGDKIISTLIQFTGSNQGALYILNDDDDRNPYLELLSLFAWDIKKIEQHKIKPGQGIVGQTLLEKQTTYLTTLPKEYIRITSGLGGANPKAVLIVPLKTDDQVYGLVELATFTEYPSHVIAFVERIGETIASSLASVRANQKNRILIEQFQHQTEEMRAQEEEMRQNMEELQATQEEMARKERDYMARIAELESAVEKMNDAASRDKLRKEFDAKESSLLKRINDLEKELALRKEQGQQWEVAEELNKALRINLEALSITREASNKKPG